MSRRLGISPKIRNQMREALRAETPPSDVTTMGDARAAVRSANAGTQAAARAAKRELRTAARSIPKPQFEYYIQPGALVHSRVERSYQNTASGDWINISSEQTGIVMDIQPSNPRFNSQPMALVAFGNQGLFKTPVRSLRVVGLDEDEDP